MHASITKIADPFSTMVQKNSFSSSKLAGIVVHSQSSGNTKDVYILKDINISFFLPISLNWLMREHDSAP